MKCILSNYYKVSIMIILFIISGMYAGDKTNKVEVTLKTLLTAVEKNDYDLFVKDGTAQLKSVMTKQMLEGVSQQLAPRMKSGYDKTFLGQLKQQGCKVYLWKMTFKDNGDDILAKLVLKDDEVAGFWLQ